MPEKKDIAHITEGLSEDTDVLWAETTAFICRSQEDIFEAGRRLIALKERLGHGNFITELERRGLDRRRAWELTLITRKFLNVRLSGHLGTKKLLILARATDKELQQLEETGEIWGLSQVDLTGLTVEELQEALRKSQEKIDRQAQQIKKLKADASKDAAFYTRNEAAQEKRLRRAWDLTITAMDVIDKLKFNNSSDKIKALILGALTQIRELADSKIQNLKAQLGSENIEPINPLPNWIKPTNVLDYKRNRKKA